MTPALGPVLPRVSAVGQRLRRALPYAVSLATLVALVAWTDSVRMLAAVAAAPAVLRGPFPRWSCMAW